MPLSTRRARSFLGTKTPLLIGSITLIGSACTERSIAAIPQEARVSHSVFGTSFQGTLEEKAEAQRLAAQEGRTLRGIEEEFLRIEKVIPGFGGFFIDSTGELIVYGPAQQSVESIRVALGQYAPNLRIRGSIKNRLISGNGVKVVSARFPFSHLVVWQSSLMRYVRPGSGIVGVDADEGHNTLTIVLDNKVPSAEEYALSSARAAGIPQEAIRFERSFHPVTANLRAAYRPTAGGLQIYSASSGTCSLGFNVTTSSGLRGFITAGHCAPGAMGTGLVDTAIGQPNLNSGNRIGEIHTNPLWNRTDFDCGVYPKCTLSDVMLAEYDSSVTSVKYIAITSSVGLNYALGSISVVSSEPVANAAYYAIEGDTVDKVGRTTGWTRGVIANTCLHAPMYTSGATDSAMHLCTVRVDKSAIGQGDSGSPVFYKEYGTDISAYGIVSGMSHSNTENDEGKRMCTQSTCFYFFSQYINIVSHLGLTPVPY